MAGLVEHRGFSVRHFDWLPSLRKQDSVVENRAVACALPKGSSYMPQRAKIREATSPQSFPAWPPTPAIDPCTWQKIAIGAQTLLAGSFWVSGKKRIGNMQLLLELLKGIQLDSSVLV